MSLPNGSISSSNPSSDNDTFRSDPSRHTPRLTYVQQSILAQTQRSKHNLDALKQQVNRFLGLLDKANIQSQDCTSSSGRQSNQLSVIYSASQRQSSFKTPSCIKQLTYENRQNLPPSEQSSSLQPVSPTLSEPLQTKNNFQNSLAFLKKYEGIEGVVVSARHLQLHFGQMQAELDCQSARNDQLSQTVMQLRQKNEFYREGLALIRGQWQSLIKSNETLVEQNLNLAGKLDNCMGHEHRLHELEKEVDYYKYLILTANQKYEQVKQESLNKSKLIRSFVDRQMIKEDTQQRNQRMKEFLARIKVTNDSDDLQQLVESFISDQQPSPSPSQPHPSPTPPVSKKPTKRRQQGIQASYRKMLFK